MRPHRRGAGGKTDRVYALVDAYWDEIEGDLTNEWGVDAMDFMRGTPGCNQRGLSGGQRSWRQFLNYIDRLALTEGTALWAAKLSDPQMLDDLWREYRKNRRLFDDIKVEEVRPPLLGHTREIAMLTNVANLLISQQISDHPEIQRMMKPLPTPVFPKEACELRWRDLSARKRSEGIDAAQERWSASVAEGRDPYG